MAENLGFRLKEASNVTRSILEIIKANLRSGEDVRISAFGKFCVKPKGKELSDRRKI
jgi:integration host factor subunit alpha